MKLIVQAEAMIDNPDVFERMIFASPEEILALWEIITSQRKEIERLRGIIPHCSKSMPGSES